MHIYPCIARSACLTCTVQRICEAGLAVFLLWSRLRHGHWYEVLNHRYRCICFLVLRLVYPFAHHAREMAVRRDYEPIVYRKKSGLARRRQAVFGFEYPLAEGIFVRAVGPCRNVCLSD